MKRLVNLLVVVCWLGTLPAIWLAWTGHYSGPVAFFWGVIAIVFTNEAINAAFRLFGYVNPTLHLRFTADAMTDSLTPSEDDLARTSA